MTLTISLTVALLLGQQPAGTRATATPAVTQALRLQVMLDRGGFSPGAIDGRMGANTRRALDAYRKQHREEAGPDIEPLTRYTITNEDVAGPFEPNIPSELNEQSKLPSLGYRDAREALGERFHTTPGFLQQLNPAAAFAAGEEIVVPNVEPLVVPLAAAMSGPHPERDGRSGRQNGTAPKGPPKADVTVTVSKSASALTVTDTAGQVLMYAPVTTGSEHDPLPVGEWKVNGVQFQPKFRYNPELFWDADPTHTKAMLPPGPNNPVGLVWIDISKEHYGLHGTPEPSTIGRTESHGCVRLTNWDALKLAGFVKPGTRVIFTN